MSTNLEDLVPEDVRNHFGWQHMPAAHRTAIAEFGFRMYTLGQYLVEDIDEIKYDGRLVILNDGSRWEVDGYDASESEGLEPPRQGSDHRRRHVQHRGRAARRCL